MGPYPILELSGPIWPNPGMDKYIMEGLNFLTFSYPIPLRSATPEDQFSKNTSAVFNSLNNASCPSGVLKSIVRLFLPRLYSL